MTLQNIEKKKLLLVDDNADILDYLSSVLSSEYTIHLANNGKEAITILNEQYIQLIITDISMPKMDGLQLCKKVRSNLDYSHIPIILLTVTNTLQSKIEGLECGADAYIEKPFSSKYLKAQIYNLLENRNKIKAHFANSPVSLIESIAHNQADSDFLLELNTIILDNIENIDLGINHIASKLNMSRATFYRKIKGISDLSPNELINLTRLKEAAILLRRTDCRINEVYNQVGYSSQKYFSTLFYKQFGMSPSDYMHSARFAQL